MKKNCLISIFTILACSTSIGAFQNNESKVNDDLNKIYDSKFFLIYKKVLQPKCSAAGCHDGNFEPDFRTIQSSYSTLVNQKIIKNNRNKLFEYRVVPYDTFASVLYHRITRSCFVDSNDRMPFADKDGLTKDKIRLIADWIMEGAPNILGEMPIQHNYVAPDIKKQYDMKGYKYGKNSAIDWSVIKKINDFYGSTIVRSDYDSILFTFYIDVNNHTDESYKTVWEFRIYNNINYSNTIYHKILKEYKNSLSITIPIASLPHEQHLYFRIIDQKDSDNKMPVDWAFDLIRCKWSMYIPNAKNK